MTTFLLPLLLYAALVLLAGLILTRRTPPSAQGPEEDGQ